MTCPGESVVPVSRIRTGRVHAARIEFQQNAVNAETSTIASFPKLLWESIGFD